MNYQKHAVMMDFASFRHWFSNPLTPHIIGMLVTKVTLQQAWPSWTECD